MNRFIVHDGSAPCKELLRSIFKFSHLLIRGLIKGLSPNLSILSTSTVEIYHYIMHNSSTP